MSLPILPWLQESLSLWSSVPSGCWVNGGAVRTWSVIMFQLSEVLAILNHTLRLHLLFTPRRSPDSMSQSVYSTHTEGAAVHLVLNISEYLRILGFYWGIFIRLGFYCSAFCFLSWTLHFRNTLHVNWKEAWYQALNLCGLGHFSGRMKVAPGSLQLCSPHSLPPAHKVMRWGQLADE